MPITEISIIKNTTMSRSSAQPLKEIFTGVHLVSITSATKGEGSDIIIRFGNGHGKYFDKTFDTYSTDFLRMCGAAGTITDTKVFSMNKDPQKSDLGARLWICIKEVWDVVGNEIQDTVNFYIFDYIACDNPERKPVVKGDPDDNKGVSSGEFYDTRQVNKNFVSEWANDFSGAKKECFGKNRECNLIYDESFEDSVVKNNNYDAFCLSEPQKVDLPPDKKKVIAEQKEMIKKVESGVKEAKVNTFSDVIAKAKENIDPTWDEM